MPSRQVVIPLFATAMVIAGCGGGSPDNSPREERGEAATRDACELLSAEEVAAVHGSPVEARGEVKSPSRSTCTYSAAGGGIEVMFLTVHWRGGKEEWDLQQSGRGIGAKMLSPEGVNVDSIVEPDPLAGIGDGAYYGGILPSLVLKGDVLLEFMMPLLKNDRLHFPELARKAASRL